MITWKIYYEGNQRRLDLLDEANQHRLVQACLNIKNSRKGRSPFKIQPKLDTNSKAIRFEYK